MSRYAVWDRLEKHAVDVQTALQEFVPAIADGDDGKYSVYTGKTDEVVGKVEAFAAAYRKGFGWERRPIRKSIR